MEIIIIAVIVLHFLIGFGWLIYKLEFEKSKPTNEKDLNA
jgi:hypothetical protein